MTKKEILRTIGFVLAVCVLMFVLCDLFELENSENSDRRFYSYRSEYPKGTIDAVYIGTSGVDRYWIAAQAYEEYGMTVYPLGSEEMPAWLYTNMIDEALAYQDPELFILDIRAFGQDVIAKEIDAPARRIIDGIDFFSMNRVKIAMKTTELIHSLDETQPRWDASYLLSFIKYHSKWSDEGYRFTENMGNRAHKFVGFYVNSYASIYADPQTPMVFDETIREDLDPVSEAALYELLEYIRQKDLKVLFVDTPQFLIESENARANRIYDILEEAGIDYVTYYTADPEGKFSIDLDPETEFYDESHVNFYGAEKFTAALSAYLNENYDLPDRREDENVNKYWDGKYDYLIESIRQYESGLNQ